MKLSNKLPMQRNVYCRCSRKKSCWVLYYFNHSAFGRGCNITKRFLEAQLKRKSSHHHRRERQIESWRRALSDVAEEIGIVESREDIVVELPDHVSCRSVIGDHDDLAAARTCLPDAQVLTAPPHKLRKVT